MKRYDDFILERMWNGSRKLSKREFFKLFKDNCKEYNPGISIYKNFLNAEIEKNEYMFLNIKNRRSSMGDNYYTLLLNNLDAWKNYPKRNQICSLNYPYREINDSHIVIPFDNSIWGVCPEHDIWSISILYAINRGGVFNASNGVVRDNNWSNFINDIEKLNKNQLKRIEDRLKIFTTKPINFEDGKDLINFFENEVTPEKLNFQLLDYNGLDREGTKKEIWTDHPCLYIKRSEYLNLF